MAGMDHSEFLKAMERQRRRRRFPTRGDIKPPPARGMYAFGLGAVLAIGPVGLHLAGWF